MLIPGFNMKDDKIHDSTTTVSVKIKRKNIFKIGHQKKLMYRNDPKFSDR